MLSHGRTSISSIHLYFDLDLGLTGKEDKEFKMRNETMISKRAKRINWNTSVFMVLFHLGAVAALFLFSWQAVLAAIVLWWVAGSLGVGIGFHRLLTHRGYKTPKLVE